MSPQIGSPERPARIVVIGSSTAFMVMPRPADSAPEPWSIQLQHLLRARGLHADVTVHSRWHATVDEVLPYFEPWVRDHFPDAVVVSLGMAECQARVVPTWLLRNTMTWLPGRSALAHKYRKSRWARFLRWSVRHLQRLLSPKVGLWCSRVPPGRFVRSMRHLAQLCSRDCGAHVLLMDIDMPHGRVLHWMPGLGARVDAYNLLLRDVADSFAGQAVSVLATSEVVAGDAHRLLPDGLHRSVEGHRLVATQVADELARRLLARSSQPVEGDSRT